MQQLVNCPVCGDVMLTDFNSAYSTIKECNRRIDHRIRLSSFDQTNEVFVIRLLVKRAPMLWAVWEIHDKRFYFSPSKIGARRHRDIQMPWFEPDTSDFQKLTDKVRLYLLFS